MNLFQMLPYQNFKMCMTGERGPEGPPGFRGRDGQPGPRGESGTSGARANGERGKIPHTLRIWLLNMILAFIF